MHVRDGAQLQNGLIFRKVLKFSIQKFILQNLDIETGLFQHENDTKGPFLGMFSTNYHVELLYNTNLMGNRII